MVVQGSVVGEAGWCFSKRSPGVERRAARWAVGPVWLRSRLGPRRPGSLTSSRIWCPPGARRSALHWCCLWHWPRKIQTLEQTQVNKHKYLFTFISVFPAVGSSIETTTWFNVHFITSHYVPCLWNVLTDFLLNKMFDRHDYTFNFSLFKWLCNIFYFLIIMVLALSTRQV